MMLPPAITLEPPLLQGQVSEAAARSPSRRFSTPHCTNDPSGGVAKVKAEARGMPRVVSGVIFDAQKPVSSVGPSASLSSANEGPTEARRDRTESGMHSENVMWEGSGGGVLLRTGSADEVTAIVNSAMSPAADVVAAILNPPQPLRDAHLSRRRVPDDVDSGLIPFYEQDIMARGQVSNGFHIDTHMHGHGGQLPGWDDSEAYDVVTTARLEAGDDGIAEYELDEFDESGCHSGAGGSQHSKRAGGHSTKHLHLRARKQKPLAPLPSGVMVGAGLEAAAQLGKSFVKRLVRTFSHANSAAMGSGADTARSASKSPQKSARAKSSLQHKRDSLTVDVSVAHVGASGAKKSDKAQGRKKASPDNSSAAAAGARVPRHPSPVRSQV